MRKTLSSLVVIFLTQLCFAQEAVITNINQEYDLTVNGQKGMKITFELDVNHCKDKEIQVIAFFYDHPSDSQRTKNFGRMNYYSTHEGQTCCWDNVTCTYEYTHWEKFVLFLPYSALKHESGLNRYSFKISVRDPKPGYQTIKSSGWRDFQVRYGTSSTTQQNSVSSSSSSSSSTKSYPYTETSVNGEITTTTTYYADGSKTITTVIKSKCSTCQGTGKCVYCTGGWHYIGVFTQACNICLGSNICKFCHGAGKTTTTSTYSTGGNTSSYGAPGATYNGSVYNSGNSGGSSSSSGGSRANTRPTCNDCHGNGRCTHCKGEGYYQLSYGGTVHTCTRCSGTGKCQTCYGRGYIITY